MVDDNPAGVSLREYIESYLVQQAALFDARQQALALAVEKQEAAYNARFESVNEWRATFGDVANRAVSQDVFNARYDEILRRLNAIEQQQAAHNGRLVGTTAGFSIASMIITLVISLVLFGG